MKVTKNNNTVNIKYKIDEKKIYLWFSIYIIIYNLQKTFFFKSSKQYIKYQRLYSTDIDLFTRAEIMALLDKLKIMNKIILNYSRGGGYSLM